MLTLKVFLMALVLIAIAFIGLSIKILILKNGKFPHTHIGGNKDLVKRGIYCAQTWDNMERKKMMKLYKREALLKLKPAPEFYANDKHVTI